MPTKHAREPGLWNWGWNQVGMLHDDDVPRNNADQIGTRMIYASSEWTADEQRLVDIAVALLWR